MDQEFEGYEHDGAHEGAFEVDESFDEDGGEASDGLDDELGVEGEEEEGAVTESAFDEDLGDEAGEGEDGVDPATEASLLAEAADYQVIGVDTRKRIRDTRVDPFRYLCKISPPGCTGTLIAPNKVLTAAHCVYNRTTKRRYRGSRVIPGKNGPSTSKTNEPFGFARAIRADFPRAFATARTYMDAWPHDFAVITLDRPIGRTVGWWKRIRAIPAAQLRRVRLNTAGYPGDKGGQHLYWTFNRVVSVRGRRVEYLHDTYGGQSGSPVWVRWKNNRSIVAIHVARDDAGRPGATPIVANRGVAITPDVLATIRTWVSR